MWWRLEVVVAAEVAAARATECSQLQEQPDRRFAAAHYSSLSRGNLLYSRHRRKASSRQRILPESLCGSTSTNCSRLACRGDHYSRRDMQDIRQTCLRFQYTSVPRLHSEAHCERCSGRHTAHQQCGTRRLVRNGQSEHRMATSRTGGGMSQFSPSQPPLHVHVYMSSPS